MPAQHTEYALKTAIEHHLTTVTGKIDVRKEVPA